MTKEKKAPKKRRKIEILGIENDWDDIKVDEGVESTDSTDDTDALPGIDPDPKEKDQDEAAAADESTDVDEAADADAAADVDDADAADAADDDDDDGLDGYAKAARALLANLAADAADAAAAADAADSADAAVDTADDAADDDMSATADAGSTVDTTADTDTTDAADGTLGTYYHKGGEKNMAVKVKDLSFYNQLGASALDFDRGMSMDASLRDWIISAITADEQLATNSLKRLAELLEKHPKLVSEARQVVDRAEEAAVPYFPVWKSKIDGKEFVKKEDAEGSIANWVTAGITTFDKAFTIKYHKYCEAADGGQTEVSDSEVVDFVKQYRGDKNKLRKFLCIPEPKQDPAKGKSDKKDDKKSDQAQPKA